MQLDRGKDFCFPSAPALLGGRLQLVYDHGNCLDLGIRQAVHIDRTVSGHVIRVLRNHCRSSQAPGRSRRAKGQRAGRPSQLTCPRRRGQEGGGFSFDYASILIWYEATVNIVGFGQSGLRCCGKRNVEATKWGIGCCKGRKPIYCIL